MIKQRYRVATFALTDEQNEWVKKCLPTNEYELYDVAQCDGITDAIVDFSVTTIINASCLKEEDFNFVTELYTDIDGCTSETIIWLGEPKPSKVLQKYFKCYNDFEEIKDNLKYILLNAHSKNKKSLEFSTKIMYALKILSAIRKKPGIKTKELAQMCELSTRSVQRYIETLRCAGELIEYDTSLKGWKLLHNVSMLIGEVFDEEFDK